MVVIENGTDQLGMLCVKSWSKGSGSRANVIVNIKKGYPKLQNLIHQVEVMVIEKGTVGIIGKSWKS